MNHDPFDCFPRGVREGEFASLHLSLIDSFLTALVGAENLDTINESLGVPTDFDGTTEDGNLNAKEFIRIADTKLWLLQRLVHESMMLSLKSPGPSKRGRGDGPSSQALDNARRWLKGHGFTLPEVKARHPQADPEAHHMGIVGRPPVPGADKTFSGHDLVSLSDYRDLPEFRD